MSQPVLIYVLFSLRFSPQLFKNLSKNTMFHIDESLHLAGLHDYINDKEVVDTLYGQVKSDVEAGLSYLLKKREEDPYQHFVPRIIYEKTSGKQAPTFDP